MAEVEQLVWRLDIAERRVVGGSRGWPQTTLSSAIEAAAPATKRRGSMNMGISFAIVIVCTSDLWMWFGRPSVLIGLQLNDIAVRLSAYHLLRVSHVFSVFRRLVAIYQKQEEHACMLSSKAKSLLLNLNILHQ
jgi:hypothetical protein